MTSVPGSFDVVGQCRGRLILSVSIALCLATKAAAAGIHCDVIQF